MRVQGFGARWAPCGTGLPDATLNPADRVHGLAWVGAVVVTATPTHACREEGCMHPSSGHAWCRACAPPGPAARRRMMRRSVFLDHVRASSVSSPSHTTLSATLGRAQVHADFFRDVPEAAPSVQTPTSAAGTPAPDLSLIHI
eukprot:350839-Chlamydomonas_euryale.AAC.6